MTGPHDPATQDPAASRAFHREQLSAMLDGGLSADESRFLLRRMQHDDELADCWQRWQLYGDALRGEAGRALPADFAQRVGRAIADDQAIAAAALADTSTRSSAAHRPLLRWGGGAALAASVALAAVLVGRGPAVPEGEALPTPAVATAAGTTQALPAAPTPAAPTGQDGSSNEAFVLAAAAVAAASATTAESRNGRPRIMATDRAETHAESRAETRAQAAPTVAAAAAPPARNARLRTESRRPATTVVADAGATRGIAADAEIVAKPWPRSLVPGAGHAGGVMAGYGDVPDTAPALPPVLRPDAGRAPAQDMPQRFQAPPAQAVEAAPGSP
jgi:negative regulator of sigma E activity